MQAQDVVKGAMNYVRLANDTRACLACHGPDPGLNSNNILRAADDPGPLTRVLNTVSAMGFLRSQMSDTDFADVSAFLGNVTRINAIDAPLLVWPITVEFGQTPMGQVSARQFIRLVNPSLTVPLAVSAITATNESMRLTNNCPASLAPLAGCDVSIEHRPTASGLQRAAIQISGPTLAQPRVIGLSGYGISGQASQLSWQLPTPVVQIDGEVLGAPVRRKLVLNNPGNMPVVLALTTVSGPQASQFRVESGCPSGSVLQAGTQCEITLSYVPGQIAESKAVLQLRSDQGNPASVLLVGTAAPPPKPVEDPLANSGGGCSVGTPTGRGFDPMLWLVAMLAASAAWLRRHRR